MKKYKITSIILATVITLSFAGCAKASTTMPSSKAQIDTTTEKVKMTTIAGKTSDDTTTNTSINKTDSKVETKPETTKETTKEFRSLAEIKKDNNISNNDPVVFVDKVTGMEFFPVLTNTPGSPMENIPYVYVKPDAAMNEKLTVISDGLSKNIFNNNPIKVENIEEIEGKQIAKINLTGDQWNNYFQGSTAGMQTTKALAESILQRQYQGKWIDGVQFTINGNKIKSEHAENIGQIIFRK